MAEDINISPTPIQRNSSDVALELTLLFYKVNPINSVEELQETYTNFFVLAKSLNGMGSTVLKKHLSKEIKEKLNLD